MLFVFNSLCFLSSVTDEGTFKWELNELGIKGGEHNLKDPNDPNEIAFFAMIFHSSQNARQVKA